MRKLIAIAAAALLMSVGVQASAEQTTNEVAKILTTLTAR